jgi:LacI family transcriptional regulator
MGETDNHGARSARRGEGGRAGIREAEKRIVRSWLRTGAEAPGRDATVTLYDVASAAGVSTATVSRVIHDLDNVRPATRERVRAVIEELGYVPDSSAQSLSTRRKQVVGLVAVERIPNQFDFERISLLFYDEVLRGMESRLRDIGWSLLVTFLGTAERDQLRRIETLTAKVDGLLIGEGVVAPPLLARIARRIPLVVVAGAPDLEGIDVVTSDNRSSTATLVAHLINEHRRRRLFFVDGPPDAPDARERRLALERTIRAHRGTALVGVHPGNFSIESGQDAGRDILAEFSVALPDAIVCANDQMAVGVVRALAAGGIAVPGEVSVTGFDDIYLATLVDPPLTTVHQPMRLLGERSVARLLERIADPLLPQRVEVLPADVVLRSSCGCASGTVARRPSSPVGVSRPAASEQWSSRPRSSRR